MTGPDVRALAARLLALAEQATPGPWVNYGDVLREEWRASKTEEIRCGDGSGSDDSIVVCWPGFDGQPNARANAAYIAAAHPAAIIELLDALTTATARLAEMEGCAGGCACEVFTSRHEAALAAFETRKREKAAEADLAAMTQGRDHYKLLVDGDRFQQQDRQIRQAHGWERDGRELPEIVDAVMDDLTAARARIEAVDVVVREYVEAKADHGRIQRHDETRHTPWPTPQREVPGTKERIAATRLNAAWRALLAIGATPPSTGHDAGGEVGR